MHHIIAELESDNSRLFKESVILREAEAGNDVFFEGVRIALDTMITFGLKQIPEKKDEDGSGLPWDSFTLALTGFTTRNVTGNTARDMIQTMMKSATKAEWNGWYRRILIKDLRCGVSEKTINNVVKKKHSKYEVPVFSCQLAHGWDDHESKAKGDRLIEVKLDGVRVITIVHPDGRVDQFSRNGKELINFPQVKAQFEAVAKEGGISQPTVFDGEIMSSSFQDLMKQVHRKSDVQSDDAVLNLFDMLPLDDFEKGKCKSTQTNRSMKLKVWHDIWSDKLNNVTIVGQELVNLDTSEGKKRFKEINQAAIDGGYEGIMVKDPNGVYECKRTTSWLKLKPFIEVSLTVTAVEIGTGRNDGRLGALVCEGEDADKFIVVNVGSGFTDSQRESFWSGRDKLVNQIVEVRADAITQNQDGTYSLRFPRFLRFRGFDCGEKI
jgi:DNA ligase-1